jgi:hypothetical protein
MHVFAASEQFVDIEAPVLFDSNNSIQGSCAHDLLTPDLWFWQSGFYYLYTNLYHIQACQFSLFKNAIVVPGGVIGSPTGSSQNSSALIFEITAAEINQSYSGAPGGLACNLQILNHTSFIPSIKLNGSDGSGSAPNQVCATVTVVLLKST